MLKRIVICTVIAAGLPAIAWADPTGTFAVTGDSTEPGKPYTGTVTVKRTGETYDVVWEIAGTRFAGIGLGAGFIAGNKFRVGPASKSDVAISIGYTSSDGSSGIAMYFEQPDGSWRGVWSYKGSEKAVSEVWTRK